LHNHLDGCTMSFWQIKDYSPVDGENPIQDWYEEQEDEVKEEFDFAVRILTITEDWAKVPEFKALKGRYAGLYEIWIDVKLFYERKKRRYRLIGIWKPDSSHFIILMPCEKKRRSYDPPLNSALDLKDKYEKQKVGMTHDRKI
jgi:hypothetical protein